LENDYLFKKWGIKSILMDNPTTFQFESIVSSDLTKKNVIMIGRADDALKRFDLGIKAMETIIKEIPDCEMNIISFPEKKYEKLIKNLNLEKKVRFVGYQQRIEIFLKNSSLYIFPSLTEAYPMVLSETKIFGIPSIIIGLDHLTLAKRGIIIIYDDDPFAIAKEAIKILKNESYRKFLGKEARRSMKNHKNSIIAKKWLQLILSVYKGKKQHFLKNSEAQRSISEKEAEKILDNQLILLKKRNPILSQLTLEKLVNFSLL
jgi:glycosyltransferase involved in cell wall biosynthesis